MRRQVDEETRKVLLFNVDYLQTILLVNLYLKPCQL